MLISCKNPPFFGLNFNPKSCVYWFLSVNGLISAFLDSGNNSNAPEKPNKMTKKGTSKL